MTTIAEKMTAEEAYKIALNDPIRRITDKKIIEESILTAVADQRVYIVEYAENVLKKRWSEGEAAILSSFTRRSPKAALIVDYAENVIKDRWLEAEKILIDIATKDLENSPYSSLETPLISEYFINLICGYSWYDDRTGEGDDKGSDNRGRWIEAEHILHQIKDPRYVLYYEYEHEYWSQAYEAKKCYDYAKDVVKGRWVEGEEVIKKHKYWWQEYKNFISEAPAVDFKNIELENLKKARAELDAKIKLLETQG